MLAIIARKIDAFNESIGKAVSWLTSILMLLVCYDVVLRYFFNTTSAGIVELEWHLFALIFLLGAGYSLKHDRHVRVDVFYASFSPKKQAIVDLLGTLFFLLPFCLIVTFYSWKFTANSFALNEGSSDPSGLPARYLIKGVIPIGFFLLFLQGISLFLKAVLVLKGNKYKREDKV